MTRRHSLAMKLLFLAIFIIVFLVVLRYFVEKNFIYPTFLEIERRDAQKDMERSIAAIEREIYHIDLLVHDWAMWDDTYRFMKDKNKAYIKSNLVDSTFTSSKINLVLIADKKGNLIYRKLVLLKPELKEIYLKKLSRAKLNPEHILLKHQDLKSSIKGIFRCERFPILIASRPVITSNGKGPIRGTVIFGKFFDNSQISCSLKKTQNIEKLLYLQSEVAQSKRDMIESFSWSDLIHNTLSLISDDLKNGVRFNLSQDIKKQKRVQNYRILLKQVLYSVLCNAIEASKNMLSPEVQLDMKVEKVDKMIYTIIIRDNGKGIKAEKLGKIFNYGSSTKDSSWGLGLHWCANTVHRIGGKMWAESKGEGQGALFYIEIPELNV